MNKATKLGPAQKNGRANVVISARETINAMGLPEGMAEKAIKSHRLRKAILSNDAAEKFFAQAGVEVPQPAKLLKATKAFSGAQAAMKELGFRVPKLSRSTLAIIKDYCDAQDTFKREKFDPHEVLIRDRNSFVCAVHALEGGPNG